MQHFHSASQERYCTCDVMSTWVCLFLLQLTNKMVNCVAYKCSNRPDKDKKKNEKRSFFRFPRPEKEKERCKRWLHDIGREDMQLSNFVWNTNKTVCSAQFHPSWVHVNHTETLKDKDTDIEGIRLKCGYTYIMRYPRENETHRDIDTQRQWHP